jgi:hypothetical protein
MRLCLSSSKTRWKYDSKTAISYLLNLWKTRTERESLLRVLSFYHQDS